MREYSDDAERILRRVHELEAKARSMARKPFIVMTVEERDAVKMHLPLPYYTTSTERARFGDVLTVHGLPIIPAELIDLLEEHAVQWQDDTHYHYLKVPKMDRFTD